METVRMMKDNSVHIEERSSYINFNPEGTATSNTTRQALWTNKGKLALAVFVGQAFVLLWVLVAKTSDVQTFSEKIFKFISTRNDSSQLNCYNKEHTDAIKNIAKILEEKIASLEERQSILFSNLTANISRIQEQDASILSDVEDMSSTDNKIKLCAIHIKTGKVVEALELLHSLDNSTLTSQIIRLAYNSNPVNVETFTEKIFKLISTRNDSAHLNSFKKENTDVIENVAAILEENIATLDQRQSILFSNLTADISRLQKQDASILSDVENMSSTDNKIKLCATHIRTGKVVEAFELLDSLNNITLLSPIITLAYNSNPVNVEKVVEFTKPLPRCSQDEIAYKTLFQEMQKSNASSMPEILLLFDATSSCATTLRMLRTELQPFVNEVISSWTDEIFSGNFGKILNFINGPAGRNHLPNLIKSVYQGSLANLDRVVEFINGLPNFPLASIGYISLLTEMKISGDLFSYEAVRLLYIIKNQPGYSNVAGESTQIHVMNDLKNILPRNIFGLVWRGEKCTVQNVRYNEYIHPSNEVVNGSREVFTWVAGNKIIGGNWEFRSRDGGISFLMRNILVTQYLIASDDSSEVDKRFVYTRHDGEEEKAAFWKIKPLGGSRFTLVSAMYNEYLFAWTPVHDGKQRRVFTRNGTIGQGIMSLEGQWRIEC